MTIYLIGQRNSSGIGNHFGAFADALRQLSVIGDHVVELDFQKPDNIVEAANRSQDTDVVISFVGMNIEDLFRGLTIQWVVFESTRIPADILRSAQACDRVWVPTEWGRTVLVANGVEADSIDVVPEGVDPARFHPHGRGHQDEIFRFLMVGKYEIRKSYAEIFQAFAAEFGDNPEVELVMKSDYFRDGDAKAQQMIGDLQSHGFKNWRLNWGYASVGVIANMYRTSDVFLSAPRGEAWGLPIIEAAAAGMPIISTVYSGHGEYLEHIASSVIAVDYKMAAVDCDEYKGYYPAADGDWGQWAIPDVDSIRSAMRQARDHHASLKTAALTNSDVIRRDYSWSVSADHAVRALIKAGVLMQ